MSKTVPWSSTWMPPPSFTSADPITSAPGRSATTWPMRRSLSQCAQARWPQPLDCPVTAASVYVSLTTKVGPLSRIPSSAQPATRQPSHRRSHPNGRRPGQQSPLKHLPRVLVRSGFLQPRCGRRRSRDDAVMYDVVCLDHDLLRRPLSCAYAEMAATVRDQCVSARVGAASSGTSGTRVRCGRELAGKIEAADRDSEAVNGAARRPRAVDGCPHFDEQDWT